MERYRQLKQDRQLADESIGHLARNPETAKYLMTDKDKTIADALARYEKAGTSQRVAMSHSAMANMDVDMKMQQRQMQAQAMASQEEERKATAEYRRALAAQTQQANAGEDLVPILSPDGKQQIGIRGTKGGIHIFPTPYDVPETPGAQPTQQPQTQPGMMDSVKNWWNKQGDVRNNPGTMSAIGMPGLTRQVQPQVAQQAQPQAPAQPRLLTPQDQQAVQWAKANPNDPRSKAILQRLGMM